MSDARPGRTTTLVKDSVARRIPQTFECLPTPANVIGHGLPDELMIDWGGVPKEAHASIYLPEVSADDMVQVAKSLYGGQRLSRVDEHTVMVDATRISYIPIPAKQGARFAGLLTLELPPGMKSGHRCTVTVRQIRSANAVPLDGAVAFAVARGVSRKVIGVFQFDVRIQSAHEVLTSDERSLGFFRWVFSTLDTSNRWYPVMQRLVGDIAQRVDGLGGNSSLIHPSPLGLLPERRPSGRPPPKNGGHHQRPHDRPDWWWPDDDCSPSSEHSGSDGKVIQLLYDRFGDFEGFCLETVSGRHRVFFSRERDLAEVAKWVWQARIRVTVYSLESEPRQAERIVVHEPPVPGFGPGQ